MNQDRNLLFGVIAVQMGFVTRKQMIDAASLWSSNQEKELSDIFLENGWIKKSEKEIIDKLIEVQIQKQGAASKVLETLGGSEAVHKSFAGSIMVTDSGQVLPSMGGTVESTDADSTGTDLTNNEKLTIEHPGRYTIKGEKGRGGIGKVLVAFDSHLGREIAVKELISVEEGVIKDQPTPISKTAAMVARFLTEARITGQLEHPSIVPVYEIGKKPDGSIYYTMKLVKGETLAEKLANEKDLEGRLKYLENFIDLCNAIAYAHSRGVIHRDIKPQNVMVGEFGETVVLDWGLAKVKGHTDETLDKLKDEIDEFKEGAGFKTVDGKALGTPSYMPPEQAEGKLDEIDERSDIYSLGAVLYEILTGQPPLTGETAYEIVGKVINEEPKKLIEINKDFPADLVAICEKALNKKKKKRYTKTQKLAEDIKNFMTGSMVTAYEYNPVEKLKKWAKKNKPVVITASIGIFLLLNLMIFTWINTSKNKQYNKYSRAKILLENARIEEQKGNYFLSNFYYINSYLYSKDNKLSEYALEGLGRSSYLNNILEVKDDIDNNHVDEYYFNYETRYYNTNIIILNSHNHQVVKNFIVRKVYRTPDKKFLILGNTIEIIIVDLENGKINKIRCDPDSFLFIIPPINNEYIITQMINNENKISKIIKLYLKEPDKEIVIKSDWDNGIIVGKNDKENLFVSDNEGKFLLTNIEMDHEEVVNHEIKFVYFAKFSDDDRYLYYIDYLIFNIYDLLEKRIVKQLRRGMTCIITDKYIVFDTGKYWYNEDTGIWDETGEILFYDKNTYEIIFNIPRIKDYNIQFNQNEDICAFFYENRLDIYDFCLKKKQLSYYFNKQIKKIEFLEDENLLLIVLNDNSKIKVNYKILPSEIKGGNGVRLSSFTINNNNNYLIWTDDMGRIFSYDFMSNKKTMIKEYLTDVMIYSSISRNNKYAGFVTSNGDVVIIDINKKEDIFRYDRFEAWKFRYYNVDFLQTSNKFIYSSSQKTVLYDLDKKEIVTSFKGGYWNKYSLNSDETKLITYTSDNKMNIWNLNNYKLEKSSTFDGKDFKAFFDSEDKVKVITFDENKMIVEIFDFENQNEKIRKRVNKNNLENFSIWSIDYFPEMNMIITYYEDYFEIYNCENNTLKSISRKDGMLIKEHLLVKNSSSLFIVSKNKIFLYNLKIFVLSKEELNKSFNEKSALILTDLTYQPLNTHASIFYNRRKNLLFDCFKYVYLYMFKDKYFKNDYLNEKINCHYLNSNIKEIIIISIIVFIVLFFIFNIPDLNKQKKKNTTVNIIETSAYFLILNTCLYFLLDKTFFNQNSEYFMAQIMNLKEVFSVYYFPCIPINVDLNFKIIFIFFIPLVVLLFILFKNERYQMIISKYKIFIIWFFTFLFLTIIFNGEIRTFLIKNDLMGQGIKFKEFSMFFILGITFAFFLPYIMNKIILPRKNSFILKLIVSTFSFTTILIINWIYISFYIFNSYYLQIIADYIYR